MTLSRTSGSTHLESRAKLQVMMSRLPKLILFRAIKIPLGNKVNHPILLRAGIEAQNKTSRLKTKLLLRTFDSLCVFLGKYFC